MQNLVTVQRSLYQSFSEQIDLFLFKRQEEKNIVIWGAGVRGLLIGCILESKGITDFIFVDNASEKQGKYVSGHIIKALKNIEIEKTVFLLSMEYQESVKPLLAEYGMKEEIDYIGIRDDSLSMFMGKLTQKVGNSILIIGEQIMQTVPIEEMGAKTLEELLEYELKIEAKILGMSCLNMRMIYDLVKAELLQNSFCKRVVLVVDLKTINSYNHLLPRTQKMELLVKLKKYEEIQNNRQFVLELKQRIDENTKRIENFKLENQYSPNRLNGEMSSIKWDRMKEYVERCLMENFDESWEECKYLKKIVKYCFLKGVEVILISEPLNLKLYDKLVGSSFREEYTKRSKWLSEYAIRSGAYYYDASILLEEEMFLSYNSPNDALYSDGRKKFAKYIIDIVRGR